MTDDTITRDDPRPHRALAITRLLQIDASGDPEATHHATATNTEQETPK